MKTIKRIVAVGGIVGLLGVGAYTAMPLLTEKVEYHTETVTEEVTVDALDVAIAEAKVASSTDIEARAQAAYEAAKRQAEVEVELRVTAEYRKRIEEREAALEKEASF